MYVCECVYIVVRMYIVSVAKTTAEYIVFISQNLHNTDLIHSVDLNKL